MDHAILLNIMEDMGIRGIVRELFLDYLSNRRQKVKIDGIFSDEQVVKTGIPQGTILGPILFLLYINCLTNSPHINGLVVSYADDTAILFRADSWDEVYLRTELGLQVVYKWLSANLLSLNVNKSSFMTFTSSVRDRPVRDIICIHKECCDKIIDCDCLVINRTQSLKYLGLILDQNLRWKPHIEYVTKRLSGLFYKFYQLRDILTHNNLRMIYSALAEPFIRYGILVWGGLFQDSLRQLNVIQNTVLKILFKKEKMYSTELLYCNLRFMNVRQLYSYRCLMWMFECGRSDFSGPARRGTRFSDYLSVPFFRKTHLQRYVFFQGPKLYNLLQPEIKEITNRSKYKAEVISFILSNYNTINEFFMTRY